VAEKLVPKSKNNRGVCSFRHLQVLAAVAKEGNIVRAAEAVSTSPSAVSQSITKLEAALGEPLL
jgi:DNA-binding transcriptional LysR family regulator